MVKYEGGICRGHTFVSSILMFLVLICDIEIKGVPPRYEFMYLFCSGIARELALYASLSEKKLFLNNENNLLCMIVNYITISLAIPMIFVADTPYNFMTIFIICDVMINSMCLGIYIRKHKQISHEELDLIIS